MRLHAEAVACGAMSRLVRAWADVARAARRSGRMRAAWHTFPR